jgi:hypothetical protein
MSDIATYVADDRLRDGTTISIRALRSDDEPDMLAAIAQSSAQSLQRRFFVMKRHFSDAERAFFMDVDFRNHVALVARAEEENRHVLVGGGPLYCFRTGQGRDGIHDSRGMARAWRRFDPHAAPHHAWTYCWPAGIHCGGITGKHCDAQDFHQVRLQGSATKGSSDHQPFAQAGTECHAQSGR